MEVSRNLEQVKTILNLAKLQESDVKPESHVLHFMPQIVDSKNVKLLEVSNETLNYITSGERYAAAKVINAFLILFYLILY